MLGFFSALQLYGPLVAKDFSRLFPTPAYGLPVPSSSSKPGPHCLAQWLLSSSLVPVPLLTLMLCHMEP